MSETVEPAHTIEAPKSANMSPAVVTTPTNVDTEESVMVTEPTMVVEPANNTTSPIEQTPVMSDATPIINDKTSNNHHVNPILSKTPVDSVEIIDAEMNSTQTMDTSSTAESTPKTDFVLKKPDPIEIYNLVRDGTLCKLPIEDFIEKLKKFSEAFFNKLEFIDILADILVQRDVEVGNTDSQIRKNFITICRHITDGHNIVPRPIVHERFEVDTIVEMKIINDKKIYMTPYNRLRTKLYFKQRKYNLLREENEGFAKVLTKLSHLTATNCQEVYSVITEIIGKYRVDPNRVLDLVLEVFEYNSRADFEIYIEFLRIFYDNRKKITDLIMLKLQFYTSLHSEQVVVVPQSYYRLMAVLIHKEILDLDDIYPLLSPPDETVLEYHQNLVEEAKAFSRKYAMAVIGENEKPQVKSVAESLSDQERLILEIDNQKVNICAHLIDIGDWDQALLIARKLPEYYCFSQRRVATSACDLIDYLIDPIYREAALPKPLVNKIPIKPKRSNLNQLTTIDEIQEQLLPMLSALGPFLSANTLVLTKVIRLLRHVLLTKQDGQDLITSEKPLYYQIIDVINDSILPATSLSGGSSCLARELWSLVRNFKYHIRYKMYYNWRDETTNPIMLRNRGQILLRAKHHMKRLSKETLRFTGRHLGKLCYTNPVITLNYILIQIQSYDNLIALVVDALRFLPAIASDALIYCVIEALSDPHKNKKSFDGMALAPWLTSLSSFSANIILRYRVEFTGFLEYIANQLKAGNSLDLVLLTDLIQKMTGIETMQAITDDRIEALMGGDVLRTEGAYFNQVKNTRKPSARLKEALIESRLAMPLCILMAQLRDSLFFNKQDETPLKLVGKLYDQCQETLVQYGVFLSMNLSINDYINFLPPLDKLMTEYKLDPDSAFFLARPMIFHKIKSKFLELKEQAAKEMRVEEGESPELSFQTIGIKFVEAARSVINPIATAIEPSLIEKFGTINMNSRLFVIFWTLSMSDIEVPVSCYEREIQRLKTTLAEFGKSAEDDPKRRKERERCNSLIQKLKQEQADQVEHTGYVRMYLESEKNNLFCERSDDGHPLVDVHLESRQYVQHCPFARSILTAYDAIYSARFLLFLHELKVEDYPTIICMDRILCDLTYMMGACTENEANHYGRFLCNILKTTTHWHSEASIYNEQCEQFPGSIIDIEQGTHITYENYKHICYKWHYRLTRAFTVALESNNYIQIRNALIVMISIIDYYPAIKHFGKGIGIKIEDVRNNEKESRQDLYALATAYAGRLDEKKPTLITESNFHFVDTKSSSSSRPSSKTSSHRERHSSSSSRKKARHT